MRAAAGIGLRAWRRRVRAAAEEARNDRLLLSHPCSSTSQTAHCSFLRLCPLVTFFPPHSLVTNLPSRLLWPRPRRDTTTFRSQSAGTPVPTATRSRSDIPRIPDIKHCVARPDCARRIARPFSSRPRRVPLPETTAQKNEPGQHKLPAPYRLRGALSHRSRSQGPAAGVHLTQRPITTACPRNEICIPNDDTTKTTLLPFILIRLSSARLNEYPSAGFARRGAR